MNIFDDDHARNNQKACQCHDWEAEIGASQEQNINKEELDLGNVKVHIILFVAD